MRALILSAVASLVGVSCTDRAGLTDTGRVVELRGGEVCLSDGPMTECVPASTVKVPSKLGIKVGSCLSVQRFGGSARYDHSTVVACPGS
jgi:hypothetical protein